MIIYLSSIHQMADEWVEAESFAKYDAASSFPAKKLTLDSIWTQDEREREMSSLDSLIYSYSSSSTTWAHSTTIVIISILPCCASGWYFSLTFHKFCISHRSSRHHKWKLGEVKWERETERAKMWAWMWETRVYWRCLLCCCSCIAFLRWLKMHWKLKWKSSKRP